MRSACSVPPGRTRLRAHTTRNGESGSRSSECAPRPATSGAADCREPRRGRLPSPRAFARAAPDSRSAGASRTRRTACGVATLDVLNISDGGVLVEGQARLHPAHVRRARRDARRRVLVRSRSCGLRRTPRRRSVRYRGALAFERTIGHDAAETRACPGSALRMTHIAQPVIRESRRPDLFATTRRTPDSDSSRGMAFP
jgi:hypothetical protein